MILIDHAVEPMRTLSALFALPRQAAMRTQGSATVIILERDRSLRHDPPAKPNPGEQQAALELPEAQAQPHLLRRIVRFIFDLIGISNVEVRIHDHMQH